MKEKILIDTYPFFEYLCCRCQEEFGWKFLEPEIHILKSKEQIKPFREFLKNKSLFFVSLIVAEIQKHQREVFRKKVPKNVHEDNSSIFWKLFLAEIERLCLTEIHVNIKSVDSVLIQKFGPVDAVSITTAQQENMCLLLRDESVSVHCRKEKIKHKNFDDFLYGL